MVGPLTISEESRSPTRHDTLVPVSRLNQGVPFRLPAAVPLVPQPRSRPDGRELLRRCRCSSIATGLLGFLINNQALIELRDSCLWSLEEQLAKLPPLPRRAAGPKFPC